MDTNARRFARRILLLHLLLLTIVLAAVALAARQIYDDGRSEVLGEAQKRQGLLAVQTARGIENHYTSIFSDMDLLRRADGDEAERATDRRSTETPDQRALHRTLVNTERTPGAGQVIGGVMWKQLDGRVTLLFSCDRYPADRSAGAATRPALAGRATAGGASADQLPPPEVGPPPDDERHGEPADGDRAPAGAAGRQPPRELRLIGTNDPSVDPAEVLHRCQSWIRSLHAPSISTFEQFTTRDGRTVGGNLVCVPLQRDRILVAVVPIRRIEGDFLRPLGGGPSTGAWLLDQQATAMAASRADLVGVSMTAMNDAALNRLAGPSITGHAAGRGVIDHGFTVGAARFGPAVVTAEPVTVANRRWELFVATPLAEVDGIVNGLFHRALWWCLFVVVSVTAILLSTATQMIRSRLRAERVRHEALTRELAQARQIQLAWLPERWRCTPELDVAAFNSPASHISGDFYNWFELPDQRMAIVIGDVTGHGMSAAFLMATTQLLVRTTLMRVADPGACLAEVNRQLCVQVFNGQFVTMLIAVLDPAIAKVHVATAGHPAPLVADGESFQPLPVEPQLVLGVDADTVYPTESFDLPCEASLLLYTDGVAECPDAECARFGTERLRRTLYGRYDAAQAMLDQVTVAVDTFRGNRALDDDLTLVAVQLQPVYSDAAAAAVPA